MSIFIKTYLASVSLSHPSTASLRGSKEGWKYYFTQVQFLALLPKTFSAQSIRGSDFYLVKSPGEKFE